MAQPFESLSDGYSQRLSAEEFSNGTFGLNMVFFDALKLASRSVDKVALTMPSGDSIAVSVNRTTAAFVGGDALHIHLNP